MKLKSEMKLFFRWIKRIFIWLLAPWMFYIFLSVSFVFTLISVYSSNRTMYLVFGTFLQVSGILLAVRGILNLRKFYGKSTPIQILNNWLAKFPKFRSGATIYADTSESGSDAFKAVVYTGISTVSDTVEERFNNIDKKLSEFAM